jgi:DHA1 family bicyclomycin/chloramphenicol resistance-like MFS transporter
MSDTPRPLPPLWFLALITLTGTLAMHIFVPTLPMVARYFGASSAAAQMTLSAYVIGLAAAQIAYGPISDRYGRRPVLVVGLLIYTVAGLIAMLSVSMEMLILMRFFEALGGGAGLVLGRAIIRDTSVGPEAARQLSLMNLMVMAGPGLSPMLGAFIAESAGWRAIFLALGCLGLLNLWLVTRYLPGSSSSSAQSGWAILHGYLRMLRSPRFLGLVVGGSFASTSMYAFVSAAPFIYIEQLGRPTQEVGLYLAINFLGTWFGSLATSRLAGRMETRLLMVGSNLVTWCGALIFLGVVLGGLLSVPAVVIPMMMVSFGAGIASPMALAEAMAVNPAMAGSSSGLYGCAQMAIGALCAALAGVGGNPALAAGVVLAGAGLISQMAFFVVGKAKG